MTGAMDLMQTYAFKLRQTFPTNNVALTAVLGIISIPIVRAIYFDYSGWYSMEAGGVPHNFIGYIMQNIVRTRKSRDVKETDCYKSWLQEPLESRSFFDEPLTERKGEAPTVCPWVAPVRQLDTKASPDLVKLLNDVLDRIAAANPSLVEVKRSRIEGGYSNAMFVLPSISASHRSAHKYWPKVPEEVYHLHCTEGSCHLFLSATDAKELLDKKWGERHPLSGRAVKLPLNYVMVYAPRTAEEVRVHELAIKAAVRYALEGKVAVN